MREFSIKFDYSAITGVADDLKDTIRTAIETLVHEVALESQQKLIETAQQKLHSSKETYIKGVKLRKIENGYEVYLAPAAQRLENGSPPYDMVPLFLASPKAKQGASGKYFIVPFEHNKPSDQLSEKGKQLLAAITAEMQALKMQTDPAKPNIKPGQNKFRVKIQPTTPMGLGKSSDSAPLLQDTYIKESFDEKGKLNRQITTFRTVTEKHRGVKWQHPEVKPKNLMEDVYKWAQQRLQDKATKRIAEILNG